MNKKPNVYGQSSENIYIPLERGSEEIIEKLTSDFKEPVHIGVFGSVEHLILLTYEKLREEYLKEGIYQLIKNSSIDITKLEPIDLSNLHFKQQIYHLKILIDEFVSKQLTTTINSYSNTLASTRRHHGRMMDLLNKYNQSLNNIIYQNIKKIHVQLATSSNASIEVDEEPQTMIDKIMIEFDEPVDIGLEGDINHLTLKTYELLRLGCLKEGIHQLLFSSLINYIKIDSNFPNEEMYSQIYQLKIKINEMIITKLEETIGSYSSTPAVTRKYHSTVLTLLEKYKSAIESVVTKDRRLLKKVEPLTLKQVQIKNSKRHQNS